MADKYSGGTGILFRHGFDEPITRASIKRLQDERARANKPLLSPEQLVRQMVSIPAERHLSRAWKLMGGTHSKRDWKDNERANNSPDSQGQPDVAATA